MTTIRDVAARAGVSVATVSHVVNESRTVSPDTKERVLAAVAELRYRPHGVARSLRRSKTGTIGVIISDITNPFFADLVRGIEHAIQLRDAQINYILSNTDEDSHKERLSLDVLLEKRVDGLIIAPAGGNQSYLADIAARRIPMVFVDRMLPRVEADAVLVNNLAATIRIVEHLIGLGHRRIGLLKATLHANSIDERVAGYRQALAENGLEFDPALVYESPSTIADACAAGLRLLSATPRPEAVFCTNNFMTLGLIRAVHEKGLRCPEDLAIAGFDDFPWADSFNPQLTTIAQPSFSMGEEAVRLLIDRMSKRRTGPAMRVVLGADLIVRESCGARLGRRQGAATAAAD
jgi:LacI family transcriptional regulator